jgi:ATP-dependent helicase/nuclease subunit A
VLTRRLPVPGSLQVGLEVEFTPEQTAAIDRRQGELLLDASAGSGKTSVLVERFVRAVLQDGVEVSAILTITFTEKAAAELRDRIRRRLRELGADDAARATEGAFISTIHGFCARALRVNALAAGIDPSFVVLDQPEAERLADGAFDDALEDLAQNVAGGVELIAAYGAGPLRGAIHGLYAELRSRGETDPALPPLPASPDLGDARSELEQAAAGAAAELGAIPNPTVRVAQALERLERGAEVIAAADPWPGDLDQLALPGGNGAALSTPVCIAYAEALARFRAACEHRRAERAHGLLGRLLRTFGERYARRKRDGSGLDFEDLELMTRELLGAGGELRERYRERFRHVMVDELQDTNRVQLELIEAVSGENLFTVGDAQQSIYGFRHADVELFERRAERLEAVGALLTLRTNFRSRPEILDALNSAFTIALGERFRPLRAGRVEPSVAEPLVELLVVDKGADWVADGLASPWRLAEARALAFRVGELIARGAAPSDVVVLTRATTDLRAYERALESLGIPTYVIGGRGYWAHPQIVDLVGYLRALANPRDEEALYTVLASPLLGVNLDALVVLAAAARASGRDPWWVLVEPEGRLDELGAGDRQKLAAFAQWFALQRALAARAGIEELIERALEITGYDLTMLAMPGGERRLANVRKLMRLGREHEAACGYDLRGFLELVRGRAAGWSAAGDSRESEAPVEGEALDAVRLMTIHRAKGLEFKIVCVADLGRGPMRRADLLRVGRDGRFGLRLAQPGTGRREPALDYRALREEQQRFEEQEERRLFYVAMTRARERLILSGAAKLDAWTNGSVAGPIAWIGPAFVPDIASRAADGSGVADAGGVSDARIRLTLVRPEDLVDRVLDIGVLNRPGPSTAPSPALPPLPPAGPAPPVSRLSYSSLGEFDRCRYRFYVERVLGLPSVPVPGTVASGGLTGTERGILAHAMLERLDFRRPMPPTAEAIIEAAERPPSAKEAEEIEALIRRFAASELCARLAQATDARREERFAFLLESVLMIGAFDVLAREPAGRMLVVDYKSDRLEGANPAQVVEGTYGTQRLVYALAAMAAGAERVDVVHVFLEAPDAPVTATFTKSEADTLQRDLGGLAAAVLERDFVVTDTPRRAVCAGCPAEGGLCSWPLEMTRREELDRLF